MKSFCFTAILISAQLFLYEPIYAHTDGNEPVWALNKEEQNELIEQLEFSKKQLELAFMEASRYVDLNGQTENGQTERRQRRFNFDSNQEAARIPKTLLTQILHYASDLEVAQMKSYLFCESGCTNSAKQDGVTPEELSLLRAVWPKIKSSFTLLFREIPVGVWLRTIHIANYSRSMGARYHYQKSAYGRFSLLAGGAGFTAAFVSTELAETFLMGPLHIVCKANYLWSIAFGSTIASLARDLQTTFSFNKNHESFMQRVFASAGRYSLLKKERALENRIILEAAGVETKLTRRNAIINELTPILEAELQTPIRSRIALDEMLWADLVNTKDVMLQNNLGEKIYSAASLPELWETEFQKLSTLTKNEQRYWWHDFHASLRSLLKIKRFEAETFHTMGFSQKINLSSLGKLDRILRQLDTMILLESNKRTDHHSYELFSKINPIAREWLTLLLSIENSKNSAQSAFIQLRLKNLEAIVQAFNHDGGQTPAQRIDGLYSEKGFSNLMKEKALLLCEGVFIQL